MHKKNTDEFGDWLKNRMYYCPLPNDRYGWPETEKITEQPKGEFDDYTIEELKKLEKKAVECEDYEKAARVRDEIKTRL